MYRKYLSFLSLLLIFLMSADLSAAPVITSITPLSGPSSGGTSVTILGTGFTGTSAVSFGGTPAASFNVTSDSQLTAVSPAHTPQAVSLTVTSNGQTSAYYVYQGNWQVYIANGGSGTVSVIDTLDNTLLGSPISVGENPCYIAFKPDGTRAFVSNEASNTVTFIDAATNASILSPVQSGGTVPNAMVLNPNGAAIYLANNNDGIVVALNTSTGSSLWTYPTGGNPSTLAITPDGTLLGVTNTATNEVIFINTATGLLNNQSNVGVSQDCIVLDPGITTAYVANNNSSSVSAIDPYTGSSSTTITVGNNPTALAVTPDGSKLYAVNAGDDTVSVIDTGTYMVTGTLSVDVFPKNILMTPDGSKAYVANNTSGTVSVINISNNSVSTISAGIGSNPYAIGILPDGSKAYVANSGSDSVSIIDTGSGTVVSSLSVELFPCCVAVTPDQAPLALFTYQTGPFGEVVFDASNSVSPVGTIANYSWNFGDGASIETSQPIVTHIYAAEGAYDVVLTVTNTAGTSTQQIFNHSSSRNFNLSDLTVTRSETISHNGGPSATITQSIIAPEPSFALPPTNLQGRQTKQKFLTQTDLINVVTWQPPQGGAAPYVYRIYRNSTLTDLIGVIPANGPIEFLDHNRRRGMVSWYYIVTVSQSGYVSVPASIRVTGH